MGRNNFVTKQQLALFISRLGHPIYLLIAFLLYVVFTIQDLSSGSMTVAGVVFIGILPLVIWNLVKTRKGVYTNFDVSVRKDRYSMYLFIFFLASLVMLFLILTRQPSSIIIGTLVVVEMVFLAFLINFKLKVSLHTAMSLYISIGMWPMNKVLAVTIFIFVPIIAWSRWQLGRHMVAELIAGALLGGFCGFQLLFFT